MRLRLQPATLFAAAILFAAGTGARAQPAAPAVGSSEDLAALARAQVFPPAAAPVAPSPAAETSLSPVVVEPKAVASTPASARETPAAKTPGANRFLWEVLSPQVAVSPLRRSPANAGPEASKVHPAWAELTIEPTGHTQVARIIPGTADIVLLQDGLYQGVRVGMMCVAARGDQLVAELVVVSSSTEGAAALITSEIQGVTLRTGDEVRLKTTLTR